VSNRADPTATRTVYFDEWVARLPSEQPIVLPPCNCPGTPHQRDSATLLTRLGYAIKGAAREATRRQGDAAGQIVLLARAVVAWNLVLPDGSPRPVDVTEIGLLDDVTVQWLVDELDEAWSEDPLPNAPSAPSPDGSLESASPTPTSPNTTEPQPSSTST